MGGTYESRSAALTAPEPAPAERAERPQLTVKFSNLEVEKRWAKASEGMRGTMTMKERVTEWLTYVAAGFKRQFFHMPNDPLYSVLRTQQRQGGRTEERRGGKEGGRTGRCRWWT